MIILEIWQKQPFDIIAMTLRGTPGLCCVYIHQLMTHMAIYTLPFTLQLCYKPLGILQWVNKSQKVHISSHDIFQRLHNVNFAWHTSGSFLREWVEKKKFSPSPINSFEYNQKSFSLNFRDDITYLMTSREDIGLPILVHSCCSKNFQIFLTSALHQLIDNANDNYGHISCLFII